MTKQDFELIKDDLQTLKLSEAVFDQLENGKEVTIRYGKRENISLGKLLFESTEKARMAVVDVWLLYAAPLTNVSPEALINDGFNSIEEAVEGLKEYYPDITEDSIVTVVVFNGDKIDFI